MKDPIKKTLFAAGIGIGVSLTSCAPIEPGVSFTTYSPGYTINELPHGYRTEVIAGTNYYYYNGNYYKRRGGSYVVVEAPRRSRYYDEYTQYGNRVYHNHPDGSSHVVSKLPRGYETVTYRGEPYYRYNDRYYRRQGSSYIIVSNPFR